MVRARVNRPRQVIGTHTFSWCGWPLSLGAGSRRPPQEQHSTATPPQPFRSPHSFTPIKKSKTSDIGCGVVVGNGSTRGVRNFPPGAGRPQPALNATSPEARQIQNAYLDGKTNQLCRPHVSRSRSSSSSHTRRSTLSGRRIPAPDCAPGVRLAAPGPSGDPHPTLDKEEQAGQRGHHSVRLGSVPRTRGPTLGTTPTAAIKIHNPGAGCHGHSVPRARSPPKQSSERRTGSQKFDGGAPCRPSFGTTPGVCLPTRRLRAARFAIRIRPSRGVAGQPVKK